MAGTLTIGTISDGTNSASVTDAIMGSARAWVNFNGVTTATVRASYNVSSVTRNGTGDYTVNFTSSMPDSNYVWTGTARNMAGNDTTRSCVDQRTTTTKTPSALAVRVMSGGTAAALADSDDISIAIFR